MEPAQEPGVWRLTLFGEFKLQAPSGERLRLPTRKVEGLLAALALRQQAGLSREELERALWPECPRYQRQTNLRQALARLRRALPDAVVSSRAWCRLSSEFPLQCDRAETSNGLLLPEFNDRWFAEERSRLQPKESNQRLMPVDAFTRLVKWYAELQPERAVDLLAGSRDFLHGIPPTELKLILDCAERGVTAGTSAHGWLLFWRSQQLLHFVSLENSQQLLSKVLLIAAEHGDAALEMEAAFALGTLSIMLSRPALAERIGHRCSAIGSKVREPLLLSRVEHFWGILRIHQGNARAGLEHLQIAGDLSHGSLLENAQIEAIRAFFHATVGDIEETLRILPSAEDLARQTNHSRLELVCRLARGTAAMNAGDLTTAVDHLERLAVDGEECGSAHVSIYSREGLAVARWNQREFAQASRDLAASASLRQKLKMKYTEWDQQRLKPVLALLAC